jgi:hypothetical protein
MSAQRSKQIQQQQGACELLAREWQVPIDDVKRLYEDEWGRLAHGARMTGFLAILTLRNVRTSLRGLAGEASTPGGPNGVVARDAAEVP